MDAAPVKGVEDVEIKVANGFEATPAVGAAAAAAKGLLIAAPVLFESCPPKIPPWLDEGTPKAFVALCGEPSAKVPVDC